MIQFVASVVLLAEPVLPGEGSPWSPAQLRRVGPGTAPSARLEDATDCGSCHPDVAAQWRTSAHAFASFNNPLYRISVERTRSEVGFEASRMCAGCHDPALLTSGGMDQPIAPSDPRGHAGVSCTVCHSATHATVDGNGSLTLRSDPALPARMEAATLEAHRARVASSTLRTVELCAACHRSFLGPLTGNASAFFGMDDFGAWQKSAYHGSLAERPDQVRPQDCRGCHMAREAAPLGDVAARGGTIASHRFLGSHTALASMRGDDDALRRVQAFMKDAVSVSISSARLDDGPFVENPSRLRPATGSHLDVDVVIFNERVGHRFPGSVLDNQGSRLDVELRSATGRLLASSSAHQLRSEVVYVEGAPLRERETHRFVSAVWNHTVPARDARAARIRFRVPCDLAPADFPLSVHARVSHQTRLSALGQRACRDAQSDRGRAFLDGAALHLGERLDPCVAAPTTIISAAALVFDESGRRSFEEAWRRGLALSVGLQEYLGEAEQAFGFARALARDRSQEGRALWGLASVAGKRGQTEQALLLLSAAGERLGDTASLRKTRGDIYAQVWRWPLAAKAYRAAAELAPDDVTVWQLLAMSEASAGRYGEALSAAQRGLALFPRDPDCLRVQALALGQLEAPQPIRDVSLAAALQWRLPDEGPAAKARCSKRVIGCAERRNPVPVYEATPSGSLTEPPAACRQGQSGTSG